MEYSVTFNKPSVLKAVAYYVQHVLEVPGDVESSYMDSTGNVHLKIEVDEPKAPEGALSLTD